MSHINKIALLALLALIFTGCSSLGHKTIRTARFDYNEAISRTSNEQLLLNLVRLKFRDMPVFLEIGGIATQYTFSKNASVGSSISLSGGADSTSSSIAAGYVEQPTITYSPLQGDKFAKQIMSSIPIETLILLSKSGWSIERILRCCVQQLNDVPNARSAAGPTPKTAPEYKKFLRVAQLIRSLHQDGVIQFGTKPHKGSRQLIMKLSESRRIAPEVEELLSLLSLKQERREFRFTFEPFSRKNNEILITPRSLLASMFFLSQSVEVPKEDIEAGRVTKTLNTDGTPFNWADVTSGLLKVHSSKNSPTNSFVKVKYRNNWYYIDDSDLSSKSTFVLLGYLFSLQAGDIRSLEPTLTLDLG